MRAKARTE